MTAEGFAAVPNWMIRETDLDIYALMVYMALASHSGRGGITPSLAVLAQEARCSERRARTALQQLEELGVVQRLPRWTTSGKRTSNSYVLAPNGSPAPGAGVAGGAGVTPAGGAGVTPAPGAGEEEPFQEEPIEVVPPTPQGGELQVAADGKLTDPEAIFEWVWKRWPNKRDKKTARQRFLRAAKRMGAAELGRAVNAHAAAYSAWSQADQDEFVPYLATWLNKERWSDPLPAPRRAGNMGVVATGMSLLDQIKARDAANAAAMEKGLGHGLG